LPAAADEDGRSRQQCEKAQGHGLNRRDVRRRFTVQRDGLTNAKRLSDLRTLNEIATRQRSNLGQQLVFLKRPLI
jgi:hypothetical protein